MHAKDYVSDGVPFVLIKNMTDTGIDATDMPRISIHDASRLEKYSLRAGDIVFSRVGRVGSCFLATVDHEGWIISGQLLRIRLPEAAIHLPFLVWALRGDSAQDFIHGSAVGSTRKSINTKILFSLQVPVPPLIEQSTIATILSAVDDAIEKTQAVIDHVRVVNRGLMQELLTRGLPVRHRRFKHTAIGEIPDDWRTSSIGDIARCDYGTSESLHADGQGIPVLRMGNLLDGRVSLDDVKYLPENRVPDELLLSNGDVLFNRTNSADLVGKVGVFDQRARVSFASYLLRLRVKSTAGSGYWLSYLLNTSTLQRKLRATATIGVSQVNINRKSLLSTIVPLPPLEEQAAIVELLDSVWRRVGAEQKRMDELTRVKHALMSVLLSGDLRVTLSSETS